jgi:hypothetical protein
MSNPWIDVIYDVRKDSGGRDPDSGSQTLRQYHKLLWSKELPNGRRFDLVDTRARAYLYHESDLGQFYLSSDSIIHTYFTWKIMNDITRLLSPEEKEDFLKLACTIGGFLIFPQNQLNSMHTINQARGVSRAICDRIDLTLECIRLHYIGQASPLCSTLKLYSDFFDLFQDFKGYCEYFLLQDLVSAGCERVEFFLPFTDFSSSPLPKSIDEYKRYMQRSMAFTSNRNNRIRKYCEELPTHPA